MLRSVTCQRVNLAQAVQLNVTFHVSASTWLRQFNRTLRSVTCQRVNLAQAIQPNVTFRYVLARQLVPGSSAERHVPICCPSATNRPHKTPRWPASPCFRCQEVPGILLLLIFDAVERVREGRQRFIHEGKQTYPSPLPTLTPHFSSTVRKAARV
jgi:hypothetical protein